MARSPLTLAASVAAALPGAEVVKAQTLTTNGEGRSDSAVVGLADGRQVVVRVPYDDATVAELATESVALRALTEGARALASFLIPEYLGSVATPPSQAFVTTFVPGYQVDTAHIPAGRGVAYSLGHTLAELHALPASIVRNAGLPARNANDVRTEVQEVIEAAAATGRVPVRLMVRWRDAVKKDAIWQFEPTVTLGGAGALAFVYHDVDEVPTVAGVIDWHGLALGDPAIDLQFLQSAPEAAESVLDAYRMTAHRSGDEYLAARSRLHAELEFARWLLHGKNSGDDSVLEDAAGMLDALAENVRDEDLLPLSEKPQLDDALAAMQNLPVRDARTPDTSMHTDVYDPSELALSGASLSHVETTAVDRDKSAAAQEDTQAFTDADLADINGSRPQRPTTARGNTGPNPLTSARPAASTNTDDVTGTDIGANASGALPFGLQETPEVEDPDATQPIDPELLAIAALDENEAARAAKAAINRWKSDA